MRTRKVGRDAITGQFISLEEARKRPKTTTVETIRTNKEVRRKKKK